MSSTFHNFKRHWRPALIVLSVGFLYTSVLAGLLSNWWADENYSHGLLVPFVIGYVIWLNFEQIRNSVEPPLFWIGGGLVAAALVLLLAGTLGAELFTQRISLVFMAAGILIYFFGVKILRAMAIPFVLLLLSIPIPQIIFNKIAFPLQIYASQIAVWGVRLFEVPTVRKGNVLEILPQGATQLIALEVVEACSGIRSLMTLITLALILVYFTRQELVKTESGWVSFFESTDFWRGLILITSAVPIAILTNAGRVTATGVLTFYYGKQATESLIHDSAGWLVYLVALILLIAVNLLLISVFRRFSKAK